MTGPEHYREAERLLATQAPPLIAKAQAHATLALAAATADAVGDYQGRAARALDWREVLKPEAVPA